MCSHGQDWVWDRAKRVGQGLQAHKLPQPFFRGPDDAYSVKASFATDQGDVNISFFVWSPLTSRHKSALIEAHPFPERADFNVGLKVGLMNDCLADAVIYSGTNGHPIRKAMMSAICEAIGGVPRELSPARLDEIDCDTTNSPPDRPLVFVTESLGSKMLFDAVRKLWAAAGSKSESARANLTRRLASLDIMFMVANQIPLLDQANPIRRGDPTKPYSSGVDDVVSIINEARSSLRAKGQRVSSEPISIVAFSDPNDLLSYRWQRKDAEITQARLINVFVSNDWTYFGSVERPDTAHCGYASNKYVIGLIARGFSGGPDLPEAGASSAPQCLN